MYLVIVRVLKIASNPCGSKAEGFLLRYYVYLLPVTYYILIEEEEEQSALQKNSYLGKDLSNIDSLIKGFNVSKID